MTHLCSQLYQDFDHQQWTQYDLETLPLVELEFLCRLMGIAHSGTKEKRIVRILSTRIVRKDLSKFQDDPDAVVASFSRDRLRWMCEQNHLWKSGNKRALAVCLLNWRNRCRAEGSKYLQACIAYSKSTGVQLDLL